MHTGSNSANVAGKKGPSKIKTVKRIVIVAVAFVLLLVLVIPVYLSSDSGKRFVVGKINRSISGRVQVGDFSMGWFKGIRVTDLSFEDEAGMTSAKVKEISTRPHYVPLLLGVVALGETLIDEPQVIINVSQGKDKSLRPVVSSQKKTAESKGKAGGLALAKIDLTVKGGNLTIKAPENKGVKSLKVSNIESKVDLNPLGKKSTFDVALAVAGGQAESKITANGNLTPAAKRSWTLKGTSGDFTVKVGNLDLETLGPLFALAGRDIDAAGILNGDVTARIDDGRFERLQASAVLSGFKKDIRGKKAMIAEPIKMDAQISSDDKNIIIDKLNFTSSFCTVDCTGGINSVDYVATADLAGLQEFAGQFADFGDYTLAGKARETGKISFDDKKITAHGQAVIEDFVAGDSKKATPVTSVKMDFELSVDRDKDILNISSFQTTADMGQVKIVDSVVPLGEGAKQELGLRIEADIDLKKAQPFVALFKSFPEGMVISGRLKSDLSVSKDKERLRVATDSTQITNVRLSQPDKKPFEDKLVRIFGDVILDFAEKTYEIRDLRIDSSQIDVTGNLNQTSVGDKTKLSGEIKADYDLAQVSNIAGAFIPQGLQMEGKRTSNIKIESVYAPDEKGSFLANLNTAAKFGFDKASYKGLNFGPTQMEIKVTEGLLTIEPFSAPVNNGKLNFATIVDLRESPTRLKVPTPIQMVDKVRITDEMTNKLLIYLNPLFANQVGISGVGDFHCEKFVYPIGKGVNKDIEIAGTVWIDDLRLKPLGLPGQIFTNQGEFEIEKTYFTLQNGILKYDDMQLNVGDNPVNFSSVIDVEKETYILKAQLPYTWEGKTVRVGQKVTDRITTPQIRGNLRDGLDWDKLVADVVEQILKRKAQELIKEKVGEFLGDEGTQLLEQLLK